MSVSFTATDYVKLYTIELYLHSESKNDNDMKTLQTAIVFRWEKLGTDDG